MKRCQASSPVERKRQENQTGWSLTTTSCSGPGAAGPQSPLTVGPRGRCHRPRSWVAWGAQAPQDACAGRVSLLLCKVQRPETVLGGKQQSSARSLSLPAVPARVSAPTPPVPTWSRNVGSAPWRSSSSRLRRQPQAAATCSGVSASVELRRGQGHRGQGHRSDPCPGPDLQPDRSPVSPPSSPGPQATPLTGHWGPRRAVTGPQGSTERAGVVPGLPGAGRQRRPAAPGWGLRRE